MSLNALSEGARAFAEGGTRAANPFDPDSEDWLCWRDGFEQAKVFSECKDARAAAIATAPPERAAGVAP